MTEKLSTENATLAISSFPQNSQVKLSIVADMVTDVVYDLTEQSKDIRTIDARPPTKTLTKQRFSKAFQKHIHALSHYGTNMVFFQKEMERAEHEGKIGLRFASAEGEGFGDIKSQIQKAAEDASMAIKEAEKKYVETLRLLISEDKEHNDFDNIETTYSKFEEIRKQSKSLFDDLKKGIEQGDSISAEIGGVGTF